MEYQEQFIRMPDSHYLLTQVTRRYTLDRSDKEDYFYAHLHESGSDKEFIDSILRSFEENSFNPKEFEPFGIEIIVDYIQRTHVLYLQKILPEIEQSILLLSEQYASGHPLLQQLHSFFHRY